MVLKEIFYDFHKHPELSYEEYETTAKIKELLEAGGIEILPLPLETGVVAIIRGGKPGPVSAIRCDIDALPIQEETMLPYQSLNAGKMHACGHDFHMTAILGAAFLLQQKKEELSGCVKVIFQPAEEAPLGAAKIVETGVMEDVEAIFGLHACAEEPVGTLGISEGSVMAAVDQFIVRFRGVGCHGGHPDDGTDPIVMMAATIMSLQSIVSRNIDPFSPAVVSVTRVEAGNTWNVIPSEAVLEGTTRSMDKKEWTLIRKRLEELAVNTARAYGGEAEVEWIPGPPPTVNDPVLTKLARDCAAEAGFLVVPEEKSMGGEDFALYLEKINGCFVKVGTGVGYPIHHPQFEVDPEAITPAAAYMANLATKWNAGS